jgi:hypothetical protein
MAKEKNCFQELALTSNISHSNFYQPATLNSREKVEADNIRNRVLKNTIIKNLFSKPHVGEKWNRNIMFTLSRISINI